jgi:HEAT repeat protein
MRRLLCGLTLLAVLAGAFPSVRAQQPAAPEASAASQEMIEQEKTRAAFEAVLAGIGKGELEFEQSREKLVALGPAVIPFAQSETIGRGKAVLFLLMATVLGDIKTEDAGKALRESVTRAEKATGPVRGKKKMWACYGLALAGQPDAVDLLNSDELPAGNIELFEKETGVEAIGTLLAPGSIPRLTAQAKRFAGKTDMQPQLVSILDALGRIADPSALPDLLPFLKHSSAEVRGAAAIAIGRLGDPAGVAPLMEMLADADAAPRAAAAEALADLKTTGDPAEIVARLDAEPERAVRVALYTLLARISGESAIEVLRASWDKPGRAVDRRWILNTVAAIGSPKGLPMLRMALNDPDESVAITAAAGLGEIGSEGAVDTLLSRLADRSWPLVQGIIQYMVAQNERRAAPRIANRLLKEYLSSPLVEAERWPDVYIMGDALVSLGYTEQLPALRDAAKIQTDPTVLRYLDGLVKRLALIEQNQADVKKWLASAKSDDRSIRLLAYGRLGAVGGDEGAGALMEMFPGASADDQPEVLRAIARGKSLAAAPLIEKVLSEPTYDVTGKARLRSMAAYAARRLGGPRMVEALRKSAERRVGQDSDVLTYLALSAGRDSVPTLRAVRVPRLRHPTGGRGVEQDRLDWILRELAVGRPIKSLDLPPEQLVMD